MSRKTSLGLASIFTLLVAASPASAQIVVLSQGESFAVQRDAGDNGNLVGGGAVDVLSHGENFHASYRDPAFAERTPGTPVAIGGGNGDIVYLAPGASTGFMAMVK
ncbi:hypothetical protein [Roseomonas marmotae]|uniref:Uncharacterized protein n=1 Tax=Roseomonas marmotae TaxID=2768161 RepID=A0ABS3KF40_9PROT|nr:hypothetical protein [Roseomonas marmotae]MBO1076093.1 hypothetical protein [Roseomonas marmotae]QTI81329.1 hypothetical protein IAI58_18415 [Roseomonas marmotae]